MLRYLLMSNGKAAKRLNALANSFRVPLRQLCSGMNIPYFKIKILPTSLLVGAIVGTLILYVDLP